MSDSPPLLLEQTAPERDAQPDSGIDAALGDTFNTRGVSNVELKSGAPVKYRDQLGFHSANVVRPSTAADTYDILLGEQQVPLSAIASIPGETLYAGCNVTYTKGAMIDTAIMIKISHELHPPVAFIRIWRRGVDRKRLIVTH